FFLEFVEHGRGNLALRPDGLRRRRHGSARRASIRLEIVPATPPRTIPDALPLLALRSTIVLPHGRIGVQVGSAENLRALESVADGGLVLVAVAAGPAAGDVE